MRAWPDEVCRRVRYRQLKCIGSQKRIVVLTSYSILSIIYNGDNDYSESMLAENPYRASRAFRNINHVENAQSRPMVAWQMTRGMLQTYSVKTPNE